MNKVAETIIKKYFEENSLVLSNIESFNHFVNFDLQKIIEDNRDIEPTIIPQNIDEFKIKLDKIWIEKPEIIEADGSKRKIYPIEARIRKLTYSSPCYIQISSHVNGVQRESFVTQVANIPIMLKSEHCHLSKLNKDELIEKGEDPDDPGGYFIINGTEKCLVSIEDLAANTFLVEKASIGVSPYVGKLFSHHGSFKILHTMERLKDGLFYLTFTRVKRIPLILVIKALGMLKDEDIMKAVSSDKQYDEVLINLFEFVDIKNQDEALDNIAKRIGITQSKDIRIERVGEIINTYLFPHLGITDDDRMNKAYNLCKMIRKFISVSTKVVSVDDKDHYMNKRLKLSGDLLSDLFRVNLKVLVGDLLYNFQRIVKRGKFPSIKVIIRDKLLTSRIYSAMATGNWVGGRKGVSQRIQRVNFLETMSNLQRVISPLSASQENFAARELHATHFGRLCPIETPEGTNIGLRKNLAILTQISKNTDECEVLKSLNNFGLRCVK